jgi:hypothetical protein
LNTCPFSPDEYRIFGKLQDQTESIENEVKGAASKVADVIGRGVKAAKADDITGPPG